MISLSVRRQSVYEYMYIYFRISVILVSLLCECLWLHPRSTCWKLSFNFLLETVYIQRVPALWFILIVLIYQTLKAHTLTNKQTHTRIRIRKIHILTNTQKHTRHDAHTHKKLTSKHITHTHIWKHIHTQIRAHKTESHTLRLPYFNYFWIELNKCS